MKTWMPVLTLALALVLPLAGCDRDEPADTNQTPAAPAPADSAPPAAPPATQAPPSSPRPAAPAPQAPADADTASAPVDARAIDRSTPQGAMAALLTAFGSGQAEQFFAVTEVADEHRPTYQAFFELMEAQKELHRAGQATYGEDAWREHFTTDVSSSFSAEEVDSFTRLLSVLDVHQDGDEAVLATEDGEQVASLVRRDGQWYARPETYLALGGLDDGPLVPALLRAHQEAIPMVGQPGMTPRRIQNEFNVAVMRAIMESEQE